MDKLWYTHAMEYYRVPYGTKKEQNSNTCNNMDESPKKTMLSEISQAQKSMYCDSISMKLQKRQNRSDKADQWLPREVGEGRGEGVQRGTRKLGVRELFYNLTVVEVTGLLPKLIKLSSLKLVSFSICK